MKSHAVLKAKSLCSAGCHHWKKGSLKEKAISNQLNNCNWSKNFIVRWSNESFKNFRIKDNLYNFLFQICLTTYLTSDAHLQKVNYKNLRKHSLILATILVLVVIFPVFIWSILDSPVLPRFAWIFFCICSYSC